MIDICWIKDLIYHTDNGGIAAWIEDDFCDDINNKKECDYDGGDCCGLSAQNNFCVDCSCKGKQNKDKQESDWFYLVNFKIFKCTFYNT